MEKKIIITGGGTAGHIMPNLALLPELQKEFDKIYYFGSSNSMEERILKDYKQVEFVAIPTTKLVRKFTLKNLAIPFKLIKSICTTKKKIRQLKPDVIFCKGGFVSVPVAIAGKMCKIPVVSHESDYSMGLANKIILKFAQTVCTTFEDTALLSKKCVCTGTPIREQIFKGQKEKVLNKFNYAPQKPVVLFFGGSLGSKNINKLVEASLNLLLEKYNVVHLTGKGNKIDLSKIAKNGYVTNSLNNNLHSDTNKNLQSSDNSTNYNKKRKESKKMYLSDVSALNVNSPNHPRTLQASDSLNDMNNANYYQTEFTNNIEDFFASADIVVCRGGANSLFELLALNKPMLIIPLSKAESRGDQLENAEYFKKKGWAEVLQEEDMTPKTLIDKLNYIIKNKNNYNKARKLANTDSNKQIVDIIIKSSKK